VRAGGVILTILALLSLLGPELVSQSPLAQDREGVYQRPSLAAHVLGTDSLGRDVLSRTLHAARLTLLTAVAGVLLAVLLGSAAGALAGLLGGVWDRLVMRSTELVMALPALYLILGLRNLFPDSIGPFEAGLIVVVSLAAVGWSGVARLVRGQVLSIRGPSCCCSSGSTSPTSSSARSPSRFSGSVLRNPLRASATCFRARSRTRASSEAAGGRGRRPLRS
jgi:peptide/nickel transport system permease protein